MTSHTVSSLLILYGSETGTAEDVAFKLFSVVRRLGIECSISCTSDYDIQNFPTERYVLFVVSTTGDGEVPSSMSGFWKFLLRRSLPSNSLVNTSFGVFGLGDSGYDKFNAVARRLVMRLKQLGAHELLPLGLGDDQAIYGYLTALDGWLANLVNILNPNCDVNSLIAPTLESPQYEVTCDGSAEVECSTMSPPLGYDTTTAAPIEARVVSNTRITSPTWNQNVFHLVLDLGACESGDRPPTPSHVAGDVLVVYPSNPPEAVDLALSILKARAEITDQSTLTADTVVSLRRAPQSAGHRRNRLDAATCTLRHLVTCVLDITAVPQRSFFEALSHFASNEDEREKLLELSSSEGADLYYNYCLRERRGYMEVLSEFKSCTVPLQRLPELIPPIRPRHYSIASSGLDHCYPHEAHLCVALVEYKTRLGRCRRGVCSQFLCDLLAGDRVKCFVRRGTFPAPSASAPLLLIGPGTGVAPMRAMLQERYGRYGSSAGAALCAPPAPPSKLPSPPRPLSTMMFFGCRSAEDDFLYASEWEQLQGERGLLGAGEGVGACRVFTAFSRVGPTDSKRCYVTHLIREHGAEVWGLMQQGSARVYVAGSAATKMPADVRKSLLEVIVQHSQSPSLTAEEAERYLLKMEREKRFCVEAWS